MSITDHFVEKADETFLNEEIRPALIAKQAASVNVHVNHGPAGFTCSYSGNGVTGDGTIVVNGNAAFVVTLIADAGSGIEQVVFENQASRPMVISSTAPEPPDCLPDSAHDPRYRMRLRSDKELLVSAKVSGLQVFHYSINMKIRLAGNPGEWISFSLDPKIINV